MDFDLKKVASTFNMALKVDLDSIVGTHVSTYILTLQPTHDTRNLFNYQSEETLY